MPVLTGFLDPSYLASNLLPYTSAFRSLRTTHSLTFTQQRRSQNMPQPVLGETCNLIGSSSKGGLRLASPQKYDAAGKNAQSCGRGLKPITQLGWSSLCVHVSGPKTTQASIFALIRPLDTSVGPGTCNTTHTTPFFLGSYAAASVLAQQTS